jgi:uncharacterized cysteine cluster protein YcgN (CxxCxxCC family)
MSRKTAGFTIKAKELSAALEITPQRLDEIIEFFDADPSDEWDLKEDDHFIYLNKNLKERLFSQQGAFAIAKYMDTIEEKTLWSRIVEFVTRHKEKIRNAFVRQKVLDNCSSLTKRNNRHFLSKKDVVNILCTSYARVNKAFEDIRRSDSPMVLLEDFDDIEGERYYSLAGVEKLCRNLGSELKNVDRREWCSAVEIVGKKTLKLLIDEEEARITKIQAAMDAARRRDKSCCQITGRRRTSHDKINVTVHHLFSKKQYPHLAMSMDNLITLAEEVHIDFHSWNGGFDKPCTIDDLIRFINEQYPDSEKASIILNQRKQALGAQQAVAS